MMVQSNGASASLVGRTDCGTEGVKYGSFVLEVVVLLGWLCLAAAYSCKEVWTMTFVTFLTVSWTLGFSDFRCGISAMTSFATIIARFIVAFLSKWFEGVLFLPVVLAA